MRTVFTTHNRLALALLTLLLSLSITVSADNLPDKLFGVEIGKTMLTRAALILSNDGREVVEREPDNMPECRYLFIYGEDKPVELWGQSWTTVMYVAENASRHPINKVFISSGLMNLQEAGAVFEEVAAVLESLYGSHRCEDDGDSRIYIQGNRYLKLWIRKAKQQQWYVCIQTGWRATSKVVTKDILK